MNAGFHPTPEEVGLPARVSEKKEEQMKELIVVIGLAILGCIIFSLILGSDSDRGLKGAITDQFVQEVEYLSD